MSQIRLSAEALVYGYSPGKGLSEPLDICCRAGEITAVLGVNGRGKTTLIHTLLGRLPPLSGQIRRHGRIGFVPQLFTPPFSYSVLDMVLMGRAAHVGLFSMPSARDVAIAEEALATLGISALAEKAFGRLSGGQRQLALIARALASQCHTLILDEPMAALDLKNQAVVLRLLKHLATARGLSILLTTHDPAHALTIAQQALLLMAERQYLYGRCDAVLNEENLSRLYGIAVKQATVAALRPYRTLVPIFTPSEEP
ncbi:ABC transporter ATP-binding protein [Brenneria populi]|uniref:ABC transporter ATP-binding protein n=1 Tax=Brenneria populi TaxID=1505588 RepID=A0ABU6JXD6_9GAMM|nr:ABC transporter ATP-binding protein [Brenneria populi Li et al. 2015]